MSLVSLVHGLESRYPEPRYGFSPDEAYPEYRLDHVSPEPNHVYAAVRRVLYEAGLDRHRFGTADWNPLGELIPRGSTVFMLCNFVYHRRPQESERDFFAKCTHGSVLRALTDYVLLAAGPNGAVRFGNAPLQSTDWRRVLRDTHADVVESFYRERSRPVTAHDLRLFVTARDGSGAIRGVERRDEHEQAVHIDLGADSLLSELGDGARYRVGDYDPRRTEGFHADGRHVYVINRLVLDADVIFSVPKLKTHEKVGVTIGLKGFVGAVGHKDCLAHHRRGDPGGNGDEYPNATPVHRGMTALHEWLQTRDPARRIWNPLRMVDRTMRRVMVRSGGTVGGAWHGNDTAWRMSLDIGRILHHADRQGVMHSRSVRSHLLLVDGVIGGDGNGPLAPDPVDSGMLLFADDVPLGDHVCASFMGLDAERIQLISRAFGLDRFPLTELAEPDGVVHVDGRERDLGAAAEVGTRFRPPPGWVDHVEAHA